MSCSATAAFDPNQTTYHGIPWCNANSAMLQNSVVRCEIPAAAKTSGLSNQHQKVILIMKYHKVKYINNSVSFRYRHPLHPSYCISYETRYTDRSARKAHINDFALREISISVGKDSEFLWSIIFPYVPTSESA